MKPVEHAKAPEYPEYKSSECDSLNGRSLFELLKRTKRWLKGFADLFFIRWANIRNEWYFHVFLGLALPLAIMVFMKFSGSVNSPDTGLYVASGNAVMALVMGHMQSICNVLAWARQKHDLE